MGCSESKLDSYNTQINVSVIDPTFLKPTNDSIRQNLRDQGIIVNTYMSVDCFISEQKDSYSHHVVVRQQTLQNLLMKLDEINSHPKIFALTKNKTDSNEYSKERKVSFINSYQELIRGLARQKKTIHMSQNIAKQFFDLLILKESNSQNEPQLYILEETLKIKNIKYKIFQSFEELQDNISNIESPIIVTDFVFHNEVVVLVSKKKIKVICFCNLGEDQSYHPYVSFVTNNFQQIVNEVTLLKPFKVSPLPTNKIFLCSSDKQFFKYKNTLESCDLKVRLFLNVRDILKVTKYYFALKILCPEEEKASIEKQISKEGLSFRVQVISVLDETENSVRGLRKVLREVKRGYLIQKKVCAMVDIIDKYHNSSKFEDIKKELTKYQISYRCFDSLTSFAKDKVYCSSIIICNFHQRHLLARYLQQADFKSKIIIYCNKNLINSAINDQGHQWTFVSSQFNKIINFIRTNKIMVPVILDHNQKKIEIQQEKIKKKQHRISALKWANSKLAQNQLNSLSVGSNKKGVMIKEPELSIIVPKLNTNPLQVKEISHDASSLLKMPYLPLNEFSKFKKDLIASLIFLKDKYKIDFPESAYEQLLETIKDKNLHLMALRTREFLGNEKEMGIKINQSLKKLDSIDNKQLTHLKEIIFLMNLNYIAYYQMPKIGTIRLVHYTKENFMEYCLSDGIIIFKNFLVMFEEGSIDPITDCTKLTLELEYSTITDSILPITPYFSFEGRYVFAPYTQFKIKSLSAENQPTADLQLIRQPDFLYYYLQENVSPQLSEYFLANIESDILVDPQQKKQVESNIKRCSILKMNKTNQYGKTIPQQKQLLSKEQEVQNIDSKYLNELLFELATYQFKNNQLDDLLQTVEEVISNNPLPFIRKECLSLLEKTNKELNKEKILQNPIQLNHSRQRTRKCIQLKQNIEKHEEEESKSEEHSSQENIQRNIFEVEQCLEIDDNLEGQFQFFQ